MARRIVNRKEKRAEFEAYERRQDEEEVEDEEESDEDDEEEEGEGESKGEEEVTDEEEDAAPAPKKRKPAKEPKPKAKPRSRAPKAAPRKRVVWVVFNNSNQRVAAYDYPKRREAEEHAAKLRADKNQTFFVQPVKEPMEEKKE